MFYILTNCTCFDHEAEPVGCYPTKEEAEAACPKVPGHWIEEYEPRLDFVNVNGSPVYS